MISERQLSTYFDSFWQHHFPLLNPTFIRRFNAEHKERLFRIDGSPLLPIPMGKEIERFDVVSEIAFELARENHKKRNEGKPDIESAFDRALAKIALIKGESGIAGLTPPEVMEAEAIASVYEDFFDVFADEGEVSFRPKIKGAGILDQMEADFCTAETLFEVKAVNRNLHSHDLRQVLCYLFAGLGSREYVWTNYCIFNPRLAVIYSGKVSDLLSYLSGRNTHECIAEVMDVLMEREQPIEAKF